MKESKQSSSRESKKSKQSRERTIPSGSRYQVLAHLENEGTVASPDTTVVTLTENSAHDFVSPAKSRRDVFNGVIREANQMFRESPNAGSEGTTSEIPILVSEEVDLEVENNLGAEIDSEIGDFGTTQGDCEDRQIKPGIDVDKGKGEAEEMISNSERFIKLTSPVAPEAAICEERDKEKEE
ncbi:hypothetical protein U1Q18_003415 [Sarracenia purpurea var. burkii]